MTKIIDSLVDIAHRFDAIVLDQWGVLHDGTQPYPSAIETLRKLKENGVRLAVLSNSGKRSAPNAARMLSMGFDEDLFETVMTSGEALWQDISAGCVTGQSFYPISRGPSDASEWAQGLDVSFVKTCDDADAVLLMGLPDGADIDTYDRQLADALARDIPLICTNPDRASPRADGLVVTSPGALAHDYKSKGGHVRFYGKPHRPVFEAVAETLGTKKLLMIGDSLEHDIAGGAAAGWQTAFIRCGLHAAAFSDEDDIHETLTQLAKDDAAPLPNYTLEYLE